MTRSSRRISLLLRAAATIAAATLAVLATAGLAGAAPAKSHLRKGSMLLAMTADGGTLVHRSGADYTLTLSGLDPRTVWFSDRPVRLSGEVPTRGVLHYWRKLGFVKSPPNAALVVSDSERRGHTMIVELTRPRDAGAGRASFDARVLDPRTVKQRDLAAHARHADASPRARFTDASLFVDNTQALFTPFSCAVGFSFFCGPPGTPIYPFTAH